MLAVVEEKGMFNNIKLQLFLEDNPTNRLNVHILELFLSLKLLQARAICLTSLSLSILN